VDGYPKEASYSAAAVSALADFPHTLAIPTRWHDNDVYGHVNNVDYYAFFDTVINKWLIEEGGLDIHRGETIGLCVESHCEFKAPLAFPETVQAGLRVGKLGSSSVRYEIGLFGEGAEAPAAEGWFVHVFVDREERRPAPIPPGVRAALERLVVEREPA
jgi:acyl-CoA thioester hydrolase